MNTFFINIYFVFFIYISGFTCLNIKKQYIIWFKNDFHLDTELKILEKSILFDFSKKTNHSRVRIFPVQKLYHNSKNKYRIFSQKYGRNEDYNDNQIKAILIDLKSMFYKNDVYRRKFINFLTGNKKQIKQIEPNKYISHLFLKNKKDNNNKFIQNKKKVFETFFMLKNITNIGDYIVSQKEKIK